VPGDTAAAATLAYEQVLAESEGYSYHGRVVYEAGWVVIQYWFFYVYNNWRSGFSGANDHEADWEVVSIYLSERADLPPLADALAANGHDPDHLLDRFVPEWLAYASHEYEGDDLRRRWDDPEVEKIDHHPVVYVAAGSHAAYFRRGEYLTELELSFLQPLAKVLDWLQQFWYNQLQQYQDEPESEEPEQASNLFRIPFVDYARGDGVRIGPRQAKDGTCLACCMRRKAGSAGIAGCGGSMRATHLLAKMHRLGQCTIATVPCVDSGMIRWVGLVWTRWPLSMRNCGWWSLNR
jgi:hypothetical protein